jgi:hypothetical protein
VNKQAANGHLDVQKLWAKYEEIAMHFNDLLMRLRSQSLAGIAAVSTLVGIFSKSGVADIQLDWLVAMAIFIALAFFWAAIWCLDFLYYNRLLMGAVTALKQLEAETATAGAPTSSINMSTLIEAEFSHKLWEGGPGRFTGILWFYGIVLAVILAGAIFSGYMYCATHPEPPPFFCGLCGS